MSDVPVGVLLSGGLDSTTLVGSLHARGRDLPTFSIGFAEPDLDERDTPAGSPTTSAPSTTRSS